MLRGTLAVVLFVALTALCWGVYGPVILEGQSAMDGSRLRPFICVGIAYFVIAVAGPLVLLKMQGEPGEWTTAGILWSLVAGAAGAIGALGIILAFSFKGKPVFVMPLVFGCAPVVNTFLTMYLARTMKEAGPMLLAGLVIVAIGAVTVLVFRPKVHPAAEVISNDKGITVVYKTVKDEKEVEERVTAPDADSLRQLDRRAFRIYQESNVTFFDNVMVTLFVLMTALAWGAYGPTLHKGQGAMHGSRLRPFLCVGIAYLVIAVVVPVVLLQAGISEREAEADFTFAGTAWSLVGGAVGAIGALGIIMAFNAGGKPIYVMPLVFGGAPVVNSFTEIVAKSMYNEIGPLFYAGLILVIVGAVMVLLFAPKHGPPKPALAPDSTKISADVT